MRIARFPEAHRVFWLLAVAVSVAGCRPASVSQSPGHGEWSAMNRMMLSSEMVLAHYSAFHRCTGVAGDAPSYWMVPQPRVTEVESAVWQALTSDSIGEPVDFGAYRRQFAGIEWSGRRFVNVIGISDAYFTDTTSVGVPATVRREWRSVPILISHPGRNQFEAVYDVEAQRVCALRFGNRA